MKKYGFKGRVKWILEILFYLYIFLAVPLLSGFAIGVIFYLVTHSWVVFCVTAILSCFITNDLISQVVPDLDKFLINNYEDEKKG